MSVTTLIAPSPYILVRQGSAPQPAAAPVVPVAAEAAPRLDRSILVPVPVGASVCVVDTSGHPVPSWVTAAEVTADWNGVAVDDIGITIGPLGRSVTITLDGTQTFGADDTLRLKYPV
ncbi:MAG TPA: hypothetical protein VGM51_09530 [Armatimonadota bacterium]|jgi:hypothetical protein